MLAQMTSIWTPYESLTYYNQSAIMSNQEKDWFFLSDITLCISYMFPLRDQSTPVGYLECNHVKLKRN
jgi:hypothetical protein